MKVMITGGNGFLGKALSAYLTGHGMEVSDLTDRFGRRIDITDSAAVKEGLADHRPDMLVHLAGLAFVLRANQEAFYRVNVLGTENLANAIVETGVARDGLICASTAGVYGNQSAALLTEDLSPAPLNHYSISKLGMELLLRKYQSDRAITIIRPFNIIGNGQNPLFLIPKLLAHYVVRSPSIEIGNLEPLRDYVALTDFCEILRQLLERPIMNQILNIGTGTGYSVREVIGLLEEVSGHRAELVQTAQHVRKDDIHCMVADTTKLLDNVSLPYGFMDLRVMLERIYRDATMAGR